MLAALSSRPSAERIPVAAPPRPADLKPWMAPLNASIARDTPSPIPAASCWIPCVMAGLFSRSRRLCNWSLSALNSGSPASRCACPNQSLRLDIIPSKVWLWASIMPPNFVFIACSRTVMDLSSGLINSPDLENSSPICLSSSRVVMPNSCIRAIASPVAPLANLPR